MVKANYNGAVFEDFKEARIEVVFQNACGEVMIAVSEIILYLLCVPKIWLLGPTFTWARNLFVFVGFGFPTMDDPMLCNLSTLLLPPTLLFTSLSHHLTFSNGCSFLSLFSSKLPTPYSSFSSPFYRPG